MKQLKRSHLAAPSVALTALLVFLCAAQCKKMTGSKDKVSKHAEAGQKTSESIVKALDISESKLKYWMELFTKEEHPFGSEAQRSLRGAIFRELKAIGLSPQVQEFRSETPNPDFFTEKPTSTDASQYLDGANIFAPLQIAKNAPCVVLMGSHYDTKIIAGRKHVGANDSGSSSVALLALAAAVAKLGTPPTDLACDIALLWFDGEEAVLWGWNDSYFRHPKRLVDNTYGSRRFVDQLQNCKRAAVSGWCTPNAMGSQIVKALVLLDMIGMPGVTLSDDEQTPEAMRALLLKGIKVLGEPSLSASPQIILDDHVPFLAKKIPAIDLIDMNNMSTWHTSEDTIENIDYSSIIKVLRLASWMALELAKSAD